MSATRAVFGPDDIVEVISFYLPSFLVAILLSVSFAAVFPVLMWFHRDLSYLKAIVVILVPIPLLFWAVYFAATIQFTTTLVLMNSESADVAEMTYEIDFKAQVRTVGCARRLVFNKRQAPNVRFYASCLIADMMAHTDETEVAQILRKVENAPVIKTEFIGGNSLTEEFFTPGQAQSPLKVRDIIRTRLHNIRDGK